MIVKERDIDKWRTKNKVWNNDFPIRQIGEPPYPQSNISICTKGSQNNTEVGWLLIGIHNNETSRVKTRNLGKPED